MLVPRTKLALVDCALFRNVVGVGADDGAKFALIYCSFRGCCVSLFLGDRAGLSYGGCVKYCFRARLRRGPRCSVLFHVYVRLHLYYGPFFGDPHLGYE